MLAQRNTPEHSDTLPFVSSHAMVVRMRMEAVQGHRSWLRDFDRRIRSRRTGNTKLFGKGLKFWPIVDGWVFPEDPGRLLESGKGVDVPVIVGSNADEATVFLKQLPVKRVIGYRLLMRMFYGEYSSQVLGFFPAKTDAEVRDALNQAVTIGVFVTAARRTARSLATGKSKVWLYHFVRVPPLPRLRVFGAFHSAEIPYVFGNMHLRWGFDEADRELSRSMVQAWTDFARTGDPNGGGAARWPAYEADTDRCLIFGKNIHGVTGLHRRACDLFDTISKKREDRGIREMESPVRRP